ncbi:MAG TPA: integrin alpha [Myxococcota bacterium]|nr:integrin alpha [Myxococcota bacterium]
MAASALAEPPSEAWLADAQRQIEAREYHASETPHGLQAPNRAHDLRTFFDASGIRVQDRTAPGDVRLLSLSLAGFGRGKRLASVPPGALKSHEERAEIARDALVEWYENSPAGLEQGFTVTKRPGGRGPLALELAVEGASPSLSGDAILFTTHPGRKLRYDHLTVADASGRALVARLAVPTPQRVRIEVEDAGAKYPLTIDPLLTGTADTELDGIQSGARFGTSVAIAGDVNGDGYADVIVGADSYDAGDADEGAAFIFLGSAAGIASAQATGAATIIQSNQFRANLGYSVAGAGDVNGDGYADVIVGAYAYDSGETDEGAAFIFLGGPSGIANGDPSSAATRIQSNQTGARLGISVAGAGDVNGDGYADVIVGADMYDAGQTDEGAAFIYLGGPSGIADGNPATANTQLESNQSSSGFGNRVAGAGDTNGDGYDDVIVGAWRYSAGETNEGAAFLFRGSSTGIANGNPSTSPTRFEANQNSAAFGYSVAGAGDVNGDGYADVIIGAVGYDSGQTDEGAAFVFHGGPGVMPNGNPGNAAAVLEANQASASMGASVAGAGDVNGDGYADVIVGESFYTNGQGAEGGAFIFLGGPAGVGNGNPSTAFARLESNHAAALFGTSVAGGGDVDGDGFADVIVGATNFGDGGAAFVYRGGNRGIVDGNLTTAAAMISSTFEIKSAASAGDVNGDGYDDIIVGVPNFPSGGLGDSGAAFIFYGSATGIGSADVTSAPGVIHSDQAGALLGWRVASAGDVNGDGYADVIVSAFRYDSGETDEGAAFVFHGGPGGIGVVDVSNAAAKIESDQAGALLSSVASAGDVNGDGYSDVIVAAPLYSDGQTNEGAVWVFHGSATGIGNRTPANADARIESDQPYALLGMACWDDLSAGCIGNIGDVASAGDVNGDGYSDVIVGAPMYNNGGLTAAGVALVFHGGPNGIRGGSPANADSVIMGNVSGTGLGVVSGAGDIDGDGYADVIVGALGYHSLGYSPAPGAAFIFRGSAAGIGNGLGAADSLLYSTDGQAKLGSVAGVGDTNGDGYADVLVGAPRYSDGELAEGVAFAFQGSSAGIPTGDVAVLASGRIESNTTTAMMGLLVAAAGDVNGDGFADVLVGMPTMADSTATSRPVMLYYGNANGTGRTVSSRQLRVSSQTPVRPWGLSHDLNGFRVSLTATHPAGRGRVKLEVQACPNGQPFGHASCSHFVSPTWMAVSAIPSGVVLGQTLSGLNSGTLYHWRARVLYAPDNVTKPGITSPPNPAHGPWRRLSSQAFEADVRADDDSDADGIADSIERAGPNDGDGNGDGIPDSEQATVASLPDGVSGNYVTIEKTSGCISLGQVTARSEADMPQQDPGYSYPRGIIGFELSCGAGDTGTVTILYRGSPAPVPPYRKYGPTTPGNPATAQWYDFPGATYGSRLVGSVSVPTVTLTLVDGGLGDSTGVDGVIVDPGGPAMAQVPALPAFAIAALALLLGASAAVALRSRRSTRA